MMTFATALLICAFDVAKMFSEEEAWKTSATDFTVENAKEGFTFASQKRDIAVCMGKGHCTWNGIEVWETRIYFDADGVKRYELSLYNKGDDSDGVAMPMAELTQLQARICETFSPGKKLPRPKTTKLKSGQYRNACSWERHGNRPELTWGTSGGSKGTVDFVRLAVNRKQAQKPKGTKKTVSGKEAQDKVKANVTKNDDGDEWIRNVPMVDQGQKGYCAAAAAERVLRYYGQNVDEHEIAQMAGTTSGGGTEANEMKRTVKEIGTKYRLGFKEVMSLGCTLDSINEDLAAYNKAAKSLKADRILMEEYTRDTIIHVSEMYAAMKPKVLKTARTKDSRYKKFLAEIKKQTSMGVPVFWSVMLGMFPEPGIPQTMGGHMRLIIGYNATTHEVLYTDTWGSGHELKRMPEDWAFTITRSIFYLRPL